MKDKKNLPLMIVMVLAVALCAGYIVVKLTGSKPAPPPPAQAQNQAGTSQAASTGSGPSDTQENPDATAVVSVPASTTLGGRDPFSPTMDIYKDASAPPASSPGYSSPYTMASSNLSSIPPVNVDLGPLPGQSTDGPSAQANSVQTDPDVIKPAEEPFPAFMLTGVITGRTNVAIIRLGEGRYIAKEGQIIDGVYKVVSVTQQGVLISRNGRSVFLKLGGEGNAS